MKRTLVVLALLCGLNAHVFGQVSNQAPTALRRFRPAPGVEYASGLLTVKVRSGERLPVGRLDRGAAKPGSLEARLQAVGVTEVREGFADYFARAEPDAADVARGIGLDRVYFLELKEETPPGLAADYFLAKDYVEYAEAVPRIRPHADPPRYDPDEPNDSAHWGHDTCRVYEAWFLTQGDSSTVIGVVDTGADVDHESLEPNFSYNLAERYGTDGVDDDSNGFLDDSLGYDFAQADADVNDGAVNVGQFNGHGSRVSGFACATVDDGIGVMGTGFDCSLLPVKAFQGSNYSTLGLFYGILYAAENGADVIVLPWGANGNIGQVFQDVINLATFAYDALVVASGGNSGVEVESYPATYDNVLSVIHVQQSKAKVGGASYNYFIDVAAPGFNLPTTNHTGGYAFGQAGSSFAAPFAAGIAGLLRTHRPDLNAQQVAEALRLTADTSFYQQNESFREKLGRGLIDAYAAVTQADDYPAVRVTDYQTSAPVEVGSDFDLAFGFVNFLADASASLQIEFEAMESGVTLSNTSFAPGAMATLDSTANTSSPLGVTLASGYSGSEFKLRVSVTDGAFEDYYYVKIPVESYVRWTGASSTDWNAAANWSNGETPGASTDVLIPGDAPRMPSLDGSAAIGSVFIDEGASLTLVDDSSLSVRGHWADYGTFVANESTVSFEGEIRQTVTGQTAFHHLKVNNFVSFDPDLSFGVEID